MQFKTLLSAAVLLVPSWAIQFTNYPFPTAIVAGQSLTLTWTGETSGQPVTIRLRQGDPNNLSTVGTITSTATGGSYTWTPDSTIVSGANYALEISQSGGTPNYSAQFAITGGSSASATISSVLSSASSALSSASSRASSLSSALSSISVASSSAANATMTTSRSSTVASSTASRTSTTSGTASSTSPPSSGARSNVQSPIALILGAVAAMMYFN